MDKIITTLEVVMPIVTAVGLGILARWKNLITAEGIGGFQKFVMQFGLPCVVFNSVLTADLGAEALTSMGLVLPLMLLGTFWAFRARKNKFPYHNFPQLFAAQETGMLGIPLFMILFGAEGDVDLTGILSFDDDEIQSQLQEIKMSVTGFGTKDAQQMFFENEVYAYGVKKGENILVPFKGVPESMFTIEDVETSL